MSACQLVPCQVHAICGSSSELSTSVSTVVFIGYDANGESMLRFYAAEAVDFPFS